MGSHDVILVDRLLSPVIKSLDEVAETFNYIVCAHKAIAQDAAVSQLAPVIDHDKTTVVLIQNGVGNEDPFREAFPRLTILSAVVCR
jgi:ketopantoate reductase